MSSPFTSPQNLNHVACGLNSLHGNGQTFLRFLGREFTRSFSSGQLDDSSMYTYSGVGEVKSICMGSKRNGES